MPERGNGLPGERAAGLQLVLSAMMAPQGVKPYPSDSPKEKKEKKVEEDMASAMQSQMLVMMPLMIRFFAFQFPIGLALCLLECVKRFGNSSAIWDFRMGSNTNLG